MDMPVVREAFLLRPSRLPARWEPRRTTFTPAIAMPALRPQTRRPEAWQEILCYVEKLQKDGRLLLRHLIRRCDVALPEDAPVGSALDGTPSDALFAPAQAIATDPARLAELLANVDILSRRAAPANVRSIRLTSSYLRMVAEEGEPPKEIRREAFWIRCCMWTLGMVAFAVFLAAVALLAHADHGQRLVQERNAVQDEYAALIKTIVGAGNAFEPVGAKPAAPTKKGTTVADTAIAPTLCHKTGDGPYWRPKTVAAADLCRQYDVLAVRLHLTSAELADWNCLTHEVLRPWSGAHNYFWPSNEAARCGFDPPDLDRPDLPAWRAHEARALASIAVIAGFVLPMLLGYLGGTAYAFRRFDHKLGTWTLEPQDGKHAVVRVLLAAMLGGLVGVVWTSGQMVTIGGYTLTLAAAAFFVGFSVEAVFSVIQSLVEKVALGVRESQPTPPPMPPPTEARMRRIAHDAIDQRVVPDATDLGLPAEHDEAETVPATRAGLQSATTRLDEQKQALAAIARMDKGSPVGVDAPALIARIDATLAATEPLLSGAPDPAALATAARRLSDTLGTVENDGLPGIIADGIAAVKGAADLLGPVIGGIPAGPVGIIGGILLGGLQLYKDQQQFDALKAALLRQPFDPAQPSRVPDPVTALAALDASPLLHDRLPDPRNAGTAIALMQRLLARASGGDLKPAGALAYELIGPQDPLGLGALFESPAELAAAIEEYRSGIVFAEASKRLDGSVMVQADHDGAPVTIGLKELAGAALGLHADPHAASAIERAVALAEALAKLPAGPQAALGLVRDALPLAAEIARTARQTRAAA